MIVLRVLVLGSNGMAGHLIKEYLSNESEFDLFGIDEEDFYSFDINVLNSIKNINPNVIINALRITTKECEDSPKTAILINGIIPKQLEALFYYSKVKIIHLSTDCVFSGDKGNYSEKDIPDGKTIYSITKTCGEIINNKDLTIRTSYIGPNLEKNNEELFDWFMKEKGTIEGYQNAIWNGVTTLELAKKIKQSIENNYCGLYHLCSKEKISKYALLSTIKKQWNKKNISINQINSQKIDRSLVDNRQDLSVVRYDKMFSELYDYMNQKQFIYGYYNYL